MSFPFKSEICQHKTENCAHQSNFMGSLKIRMRAPIGFSWQGLVWPGKLFTEGENDGQFPAVKLSGRRAEKTHPGQDSCWH